MTVPYADCAASLARCQLPEEMTDLTSALSLCSQVQALAQSTIQDLHNKLAARSAEVEDGERRLQAARSLAAAEVGGLQDQIELLTQQLQLQDQRHVKVSPEY